MMQIQRWAAVGDSGPLAATSSFCIRFHGRWLSVPLDLVVRMNRVMVGMSLRELNRESWTPIALHCFHSLLAFLIGQPPGQ
jgi:hypothetical protein